MIVPQYFVVRDLAPFKVLVSYSVQGLRAYHMPGTDNEMTTKAFHRNNSCPHWTYSQVGIQNSATEEPMVQKKPATGTFNPARKGQCDLLEE